MAYAGVVRGRYGGYRGGYRGGFRGPRMNKQQQNDAPIVLRKPEFCKVETIDPNATGLNLYVYVVKVGSIEHDKKLKRRQNPADDRVGEALVGDDSGVILVMLRPHQVESCRPGGTIIIRNARVRVEKGTMKLEVDKWGKIEVSPEKLGTEVNTDHNMSEIEYELVSIEQ